MEKSVVGQKLKLLHINGINSAKETDANDENLDEDIGEEDYCEPVSMQETQDRCMVSFMPCPFTSPKMLWAGSKFLH